MAKKEYSLDVNRREKKARSKRLRELGGGSGGSGSTVVEVSSSGVGGGSQHSHANLTTLDKLSADDADYVYLDQLREGTDEDGNPVWATEREKVKSGYADEAQNLAEDSSDWATIDTKDAETLQAAKDYTDATALSKVHDDTAKGVLTIEKQMRTLTGLATEEYDTPGNADNVLGRGFELVKDMATGRTRLEVDELLVRLKAWFAELEIRRLSYLGGNYVFSSAGSKVYHVEKVSDGWRCYFYSDDGSTGTMNYWQVGDQARCQTFNLDGEGTYHAVGNKYYWRLVTQVGKGRIAGKTTADGSADETEYQWAVLSDTDYDGEDAPEAGDSLVQMGNRNDATRQGLIYLMTEGASAPALQIYSGVGAKYPYYSLPAPQVQLSPHGNIIYGEFHSVANGGANIDELLSGLSAELAEVRGQTDQKYEMWFFAHSPLPTATADGVNAPASDWTTDEQKALHLQDLFYDTSAEPASSGGRAFRWVYRDGRYYWEGVTDQDTLDSLERIANVAGDGTLTGGAEKGRVLVDWTRVVSELKKYTEQAGDYQSQESAMGYDVSTPLNAFITAFEALGRLLNDGTALEYDLTTGVVATPAWLQDLHTTTPVSDPAAYRAAWDGYYYALAALLRAINAAAKALADHAQASAESAQAMIDAIVADGVLDASEKQTVKREFVAAWHEKNDDGGLLDQAQDVSGRWLADVLAYTHAFVALGRYLNGEGLTGSQWQDPAELSDANLPLWIQAAEMTTDVAIDADEFRGVWSVFASARTDLLTALSAQAQASADAAQTSADEAHDRIDDIEDDGVISGGTEKSQLYIQWQKAVSDYRKYTEQAGDYSDETTVVSTSALSSAYTALLRMLNNGGQPTQAIATGTAAPQWLSDLSTDTVLAETPTGTATAYRQTWQCFNDALATLMEAIARRAKELSDAAQATADVAVNSLTAIASDNQLDRSELPDVRREFMEALHEMWDEGGLLDQCKDDEEAWIGHVDVLAQDLEDAIKRIGTFLNGSNGTWKYEVTATEKTVSGKTVTMYALDWTHLSGHLPTYLAPDYEYTEAIAIDGERFVRLWADWYTKRTEILGYLSAMAHQAADAAQASADHAQDEIDLITADGILSRVEKKQVRREFEGIIRNKQYNLVLASSFKVSSSGYGRDSHGRNIVEQYTEAYLSLGGYLNGDNEAGSQTAWTADTVPLWLSDGELDTDQVIDAGVYRSRWVAYYDSEHALLNALSQIAKQAGDDALSELSAIATDGKVTPTEKAALLLSWTAAVSELPLLCNMADIYMEDARLSELTSTIAVYKSDYVTAFNKLGQVLNGGSTYHYTTGSGTFPRPLWLSQDRMGTTEELTEAEQTDFNTAWDGYYRERTYLQDLLAEASKKPGSDALGVLDNLADDDVLTPQEKLTVIREWSRYDAERSELLADAAEAHVDSTDYSVAFASLSNYLHDRGVSKGWTSGVPKMLTEAGDSAIDGTAYKTRWNAFFTARTALVSAIGNAHVNVFVQESRPSTPYKKGDQWLIPSTRQMLLCVQSRGASEAGSDSDWVAMEDVTEKRDPRLLLAAVGEQLWSLVGTYIAGGSILLRLGGSMPQNPAAGTVWYDGEGGVNYYTTVWYGAANQLLRNALRGLYGALGACDLRVWGNLSEDATLWDLCVYNVSFTDPFSGETVAGDIGVLTYGENGWETLREGTRGLIENLGKQLRLVVYGSLSGDNGTIGASGILTQKNITRLFSRATDTDGKILTEACLDTYVEKDDEGYLSGVRIKGDLIDIDASHKLRISGRVAVNDKFVIHEDGHLQLESLNAQRATISASRLKDVHIDGVVAQPFVVENSTASYQWGDDGEAKTYYAAMGHDNLLYNSAAHQLYWTPECSGRLLTLCHHESVSGSTSFSAPTVYSETAPSVGSGEYLWARGVVKYENGVKRYTRNGAVDRIFRISNGNAVSSVVKQYYLSDSASSLSGGSWSSTAAVTAGKHVWVRCIVYYSGGGSTTSDAYLLSSALNDARKEVNIEFAKNTSQTTAPADLCFYEDGQKKKTITVSRQCLLLKGYGTDTVFLGYIVLRRIDLAPQRSYGMEAKCLAMGVIGSNSAQDGVTFGSGDYVTFDGSALTGSLVECGVYKVDIPDQWNIQASDLQVMVSAQGNIVSGSNPLYAGLQGIESDANGIATAFTVQCGDDASRNNGSVQFMVYNRADWRSI